MKKTLTKACLEGLLLANMFSGYAQSIEIKENSILDMQSANCFTPTTHGPTAIAREGNYLYVGYWSGTFTPDGKSRIETFDISSGTPVSVGVVDLEPEGTQIVLFWIYLFMKEKCM